MSEAANNDSLLFSHAKIQAPLNELRIRLDRLTDHDRIKLWNTLKKGYCECCGRKIENGDRCSCRKKFYVAFQAQTQFGTPIVIGNEVIEVAGVLPTRDELAQVIAKFCEGASKRNQITFPTSACAITFFHEILPT